SNAVEVASAISETVRRARAGGSRRLPVFAVSLGDTPGATDLLSGAAIPHFSTDSEAVEGFLHLVRYR
ncbi:hypothetical protein, partial [Klebsiella pneumoniae]